jgi:hypothetical protein
VVASAHAYPATRLAPLARSQTPFNINLDHNITWSTRGFRATRSRNTRENEGFERVDGRSVSSLETLTLDSKIVAHPLQDGAHRGGLVPEDDIVPLLPNTP